MKIIFKRALGKGYISYQECKFSDLTFKKTHTSITKMSASWILDTTIWWKLLVPSFQFMSLPPLSLVPQKKINRQKDSQENATTTPQPMRKFIDSTHRRRCFPVSRLMPSVHKAGQFTVGDGILHILQGLKNRWFFHKVSFLRWVIYHQTLK